MTGDWSGAEIVRRADAVWRRADRLVEVLGLGAHDVLTIMHLVEVATDEGAPLARVIGAVDLLGLNCGPFSTASVVEAVAASASVDGVPAPAVVA